MPTENPKISAYVPQIVYDRFNQYKDERKLSMSQAVVQLVAEYFGINLVDNSTSKFTSGLPEKIEQLEKIVFELKESYVYLSEKVDSFQSTSKPLKTESKINSTDIQNSSSIISDDTNVTTSSLSQVSNEELPSESKGKLLEDDKIISDDNLPDELPVPPIVNTLIEGELSSESESGMTINTSESENYNKSLDTSKDALPRKGQVQESVQLNFIDSSNNSLEGLSLSAVKLGKRLSIDRLTLGSRRKKVSIEDFATMTENRDPNAIRWAYSEELKCYVPYGELSLEQIESLKLWKEKQSTR